MTQLRTEEGKKSQTERKKGKGGNWARRVQGFGTFERGMGVKKKRAGRGAAGRSLSACPLLACVMTSSFI